MNLPDTLTIEVTEADVKDALAKAGHEQDMCETCPTAQALNRTYPTEFGWVAGRWFAFPSRHSISLGEFRYDSALREEVRAFSCRGDFRPGTYQLDRQRQ